MSIDSVEFDWEKFPPIISVPIVSTGSIGRSGVEAYSQFVVVIELN